MRDETGSASIVVAVMAGVIVMLALGAADVARVFATASRAQSAADAAALAAAQELAFPGDAGTPAEIAAAYAARNGGTLQRCTCDPGSFVADVEVRVSVGALAIGPDDLEVTAAARAVVDLPAP